MRFSIWHLPSFYLLFWLPVLWPPSLFLEVSEPGDILGIIQWAGWSSSWSGSALGNLLELGASLGSQQVSGHLMLWSETWSQQDKNEEEIIQLKLFVLQTLSNRWGQHKWLCPCEPVRGQVSGDSSKFKDTQSCFPTNTKSFRIHFVRIAHAWRKV